MTPKCSAEGKSQENRGYAVISFTGNSRKYALSTETNQWLPGVDGTGQGGSGGQGCPGGDAVLTALNA